VENLEKEGRKYATRRREREVIKDLEEEGNRVTRVDTYSDSEIIVISYIPLGETD
jgi:hypothetical protein